MCLPAPVLVQVSERSRRVRALPELDVGPDGLLRRKSVEKPLVEELLDQGEPTADAKAFVETILTRTYPDNPDPLTRARSRFYGAEHSLWLSTIMTKGDDRPDPNLPLKTMGAQRRLDHRDSISE